MGNIQRMLNHRNIRPLTLQERAARVAELQAQQEMERRQTLAALDEWEWGPGRPGRKPIVLPPEIARRVLADVAAGRSLCEIVRKYQGSYPFSRRWLSDAVQDGRLERMAEATGSYTGTIAGENRWASRPQ